MNDTNTNKADDMNEDDVTLTGSEGENTAVESDAAADATADTATESPDAAGASDSTTVPDSVQFSIVFDDDGDDSDAIVIDAADAEIDTTAEADTTVATDAPPRRHRPTTRSPEMIRRMPPRRSRPVPTTLPITPVPIPAMLIPAPRRRTPPTRTWMWQRPTPARSTKHSS